MGSETTGFLVVSDPCPKREGTNAAHCDHATGQSAMSYPPRRIFQCCFCGRTRVEDPPPTSFSYVQRKEDHGPFYSEPRVYFDAR